ncbi:MAG TPA: hypothetical protein VKG38_16865 [Solirubrobacteraceae bacterium]|nr:hypothetical protein [Solirubrobacteraceae bacterium]
MNATTYDTNPGFQASAAARDIATDDDMAPASASAEMASRVYRGRSIEELIPKIQIELGHEAIILRRRSGLTGGIAGFFQRRFVEIEARPGAPRIDLYDDPGARGQEPGMASSAGAGARAKSAPDTTAPPRPQPVPRREEHRPAPPPEHQPALAEVPSAPPRADPAPAQPRTDRAPAEPRVGRSPAAPPADTSRAGRLQSYSRSPDYGLTAGAHIDTPTADADSSDPGSSVAEGVNGSRLDTQDGFRELTPESLLSPPRARNGTAPAISLEDGYSFAAALAEAEEALPHAGVEESLLELGMGEQMVGELVEIAERDALPLMTPRASMADAVRLVLRIRIPRGKPLAAGSATVAVVGSGGSGKTALCTALLERHRRSETKPAACATILAPQGPGGHAMVLAPHIPEPTPIADPRAAGALRRAHEEGLLLLDMPAVSPGDRQSVDALAALLETLAPDRVILALPATLGARPASQLLGAMRPLRASALAITHADETDQLGVAVQTACAFGLAPEYLLDFARGNGGLRQIDPTYLADRLLA